MMREGFLTSVALKFSLAALVVAASSTLGFAQSSGASSSTRQGRSAADYSRASQSIVLGSGEADSSRQDLGSSEKLDKILRQLETVLRRLEALEGTRGSAARPDDDKSKTLLTNLDIITKGEQRVDLLRKQLFEIIDKESAVRAKLDQVEADLRPEAIERNSAFMGSLRPEEAREARRRNLEAERRSLQATLAEIQAFRINIDGNLRKAESLVEKLREKFEKDIENALQN